MTASASPTRASSASDRSGSHLTSCAAREPGQHGEGVTVLRSRSTSPLPEEPRASGHEESHTRTMECRTCRVKPRNALLTNWLVNTGRPRGADAPPPFSRPPRTSSPSAAMTPPALTASPRRRTSTRRCSITTTAASRACTWRSFATCSARSGRARARLPTARPRRDKIDAWILTIVEEAAARPWFPPIMLRELASGAAHIDGEPSA